MNQNTQYFVGIDISKSWFDAALQAMTNRSKDPVHTERFNNDAAGLKAFGHWLASYGARKGTDTRLVMENTGIYHRPLWQWASASGIPIHIGNAAHIKWSLGITRGKDDKTDSIRLCHYAAKEADSLKAAPTLNPAILRLKDFQSSRTRLLAQLGANEGYLAELKNINDKGTQKVLEQAYRSAIEGLKQSINAIEAEIKAILNANAELKANYKLLLSVPGIGHVTAVYLLCCTANFIARPSGKQLACYAGLAPFESSSGSARRGRPRVHKMANKELKRLLYMGALAAIQHNAELKAYYTRKMAEGKAHLSVLNA
ncbi:MAG: IS110 family transposase, partial [Bacteroidetes bacterium]|nr:IS110 family transposase [Bacteroidota bacterium]